MVGTSDSNGRPRGRNPRAPPMPFDTEGRHLHRRVKSPGTWHLSSELSP